MDRPDAHPPDAAQPRTRLVAADGMQILLFSLGTSETFGIDVFKVREVTRTPFTTWTPNMPPGVEGLVSLRGNVIPVLALGRIMQLRDLPSGLGEAMMVAEHRERVLGVAVHSVDRIVRVGSDGLRASDELIAEAPGFVAAVAGLPDGRLVSILDIESVLADTLRPLLAKSITGD
jgi:two-component system chemotaxis response regulator CheV